MEKKKQFGRELLTDYFYAMSVPACHNCIGTEYELIGLRKRDLSRLPYEGENSIKSVLNFIQDRTGSEPVRENENLIGLKNENYSLTIEPGGQLEASFVTTETVDQLEKKLSAYILLLRELEDQGIVFVTSGVDPFNRFSAIPLVPKERYRLMWQYWSRHSGLSCYMMTLTASIHINIDYNSEEDAVKKLNLARRLQTIIQGLFSNSCVYNRRLKPSDSLRQEIWNRTDLSRTGPGTCWRKPINSFQDYVDCALDTPMIFIRRDGKYFPAGENFTFRYFMENGYRGYYPGLKEWILHLNTLFLPIRFNRSILELRFFDCNQPRNLLAMNALVKGIFYGRDIPVDNPGGEELLNFALNNLDAGDKQYLSPIKEMLENGVTPAELTRREYRNNPDVFKLCNYLQVE